MKKPFPFENEAFELLTKLEKGLISQADVAEWAGKKLLSIEYDDAIADIVLSEKIPIEQFKSRLMNIISDCPKRQLQYKAKSVAMEIIELSNQMNTIDDKSNFAREFCKLGGILNELSPEKQYTTFWIIDDEIEGLPLNNERLRSLWNEEALKTKDAELDSIIDFYRSDVVETCRQIIKEIEPAG